MRMQPTDQRCTTYAHAAAITRMLAVAEFLYLHVFVRFSCLQPETNRSDLLTLHRSPTNVDVTAAVSAAKRAICVEAF
jgi:hypothetical protein